MSFDPRCDVRWKNVIAPAIAAVGIGDDRLKPHRVDLGIAGGSILTEILDSIARCRIFIGDITALDELNGNQSVNWAAQNQSAYQKARQLLARCKDWANSRRKAGIRARVDRHVLDRQHVSG